MKRQLARLLTLLLLMMLLIACGADELPLPRDSRDAVPPTLVPGNAPAEATAEPITQDPGGYARAFYRAWEGGDYDAMYSLLAPRSQQLVGKDAFIQRYRSATQTASVQSIHTQPLSLVQDGRYAEFGVRVTWDTVLVGEIVREFTVPLLYEEDRWGIVWDEGLILPELAGGNRLVMETQVPSRANIYDINGQALAFQGEAIQLSIIRDEIVDEPGLLNALSSILSWAPEQIRSRYAEAAPQQKVYIADISRDMLEANVLALNPYFGAGLVADGPVPARFYTDSGIAAHILGYTGPIPAESLDEYLSRGYAGDETVGLTAVEAWGEDYLNGQRGGRLSVRGPANEEVAVLAESEPRQARSLYLTIDSEFQAAVEQALAEAITTHPLGAAGAVAVLDVNTGAVKALASFPSYDPRVFNTAVSDTPTDLNAVLNDPGRPLLSRATQGAYPAGSVFKIVTLGAAILSGQYTFDTPYTSTGSWSRLGEEFVKYDWRPGGHGTISLRQALVVSCNSCFYDVGYNLDGVDSTLLPSVARQFGLGQGTGIEGVPESAGLIPDPEWKMANVGEGWATGDAVNMAIGQGYVQVTPLQIARMAAAVANGGTLYRPRVIDRIGAGGGAPEEPWPTEVNGSLPLSPDQIAVMQESLWNVANGAWGTATDKFVDLPVQVAGKTGTAEAPPNNPHAWFAGYAPAAPYTTSDGTLISEPEIAIAIIMENAGEGSAVAAPIFRRIVELYYGIPTTPFPW